MSRRQALSLLVGALLVVQFGHLLALTPSEPFFNNDETRHVMTGVFFRDFFTDRPFDHLRDYTVRYYLQYPALGLLVWPPFFYVLEGLCMLVLGTSTAVSKGLVAAFGVMASVYLFRLVRRTHDAFTAALAVLFLGFAPLVFAHARQVMLEVPTLALALGAIFHFVRYLDEERCRDLFTAALLAALAALTRFDAAYLLPLFGLLLLVRGRLALLRRKVVWIAAALALVLVVPPYLATIREFGQVHARSIVEAPDEAAQGPGRLLDYPLSLPEQIGWLPLLAALVGLVVALRRDRRAAAWPYLAMVFTTYAVFSPMGEHEGRHVIYWVPGFALLAAEGSLFLARRVRLSRLQLAIPTLLLASIAWRCCYHPTPYLRGYEEAARFVVANSSASPCCLFDSYLNGDFIYQVRRSDPSRRLYVLRGDKVFPRTPSDKAEALKVLSHYDPEWIVVEDPQIETSLQGVLSLRALLQEHPERFELAATVDLDSNVELFRGVRLYLYRNRVRSEQPRLPSESGLFGLRGAALKTLPASPSPPAPRSRS